MPSTTRFYLLTYLLTDLIEKIVIDYLHGLIDL